MNRGKAPRLVRLVLGMLEMIFGGIGAACVGRVLFTKRPPKKRWCLTAFAFRIS